MENQAYNGAIPMSRNITKAEFVTKTKTVVRTENHNKFKRKVKMYKH